MNNFCDLAEELGVSEQLLQQWEYDLQLLAGDCLEGLQPTHRARALFYLVAYFASLATPQVTNERLGDASLSFAEQAKDMRAHPYGRMALQFAPCLASLGATKGYTVRLLR